MEQYTGPYAARAVDYFDAGYAPLPIPLGEKSPPPPGWTGQDARWPSRADVQSWIESNGRDNIAIRLPAGVIGLDVDAYGAKHGGLTLEGMTSRCGPLPETMTITSRDDGVSGIRLYRYAGDPDELVGTVNGIDLIKPGHRYAVTAPSLHPEGMIYRAEPMTAAADLPELPTAWAAELKGTRLFVVGSEGIDLADLPEAGDDGACSKIIRAGAKDVEPGASRHDHYTGRVMAIVRLGAEGHAGAAETLRGVRQLFLDDVAGDRPLGLARDEFDRMVGGALAKTDLADQEQCGGAACDDAGWGILEPSGASGYLGPDKHQGSGARESQGAPYGRERPDLDFGQHARMARIEHVALDYGISPYALLGVTLARIAAAVPVGFRTPDYARGPGSPNLFVVLLGRPGAGKSLAFRASKQHFEIRTGLLDQVAEREPASGESIPKAMAFADKDGTVTVDNPNVLIRFDEVDAITGRMDRAGDITTSVLRSVWTAETIGAIRADRSAGVTVPADSYSLGMVVNVQPGKGGGLFDNETGGWPQRFLWCDADPIGEFKRVECDVGDVIDLADLPRTAVAAEEAALDMLFGVAKAEWLGEAPQHRAYALAKVATLLAVLKRPGDPKVTTVEVDEAVVLAARQDVLREEERSRSRASAREQLLSQGAAAATRMEGQVASLLERSALSAKTRRTSHLLSPECEAGCRYSCFKIGSVRRKGLKLRETLDAAVAAGFLTESQGLFRLLNE